MKKWSKNYDSCTVCHRTTSKYKCKGKCDPCYVSYWRSLKPERISTKKAYAKKSRQKMNKTPAWVIHQRELKAKWRLSKKGRFYMATRERTKRFLKGSKVDLGIMYRDENGNLVQTNIKPSGTTDTDTTIKQLEIFKRVKKYTAVHY